MAQIGQGGGELKTARGDFVADNIVIYIKFI